MKIRLAVCFSLTYLALVSAAFADNCVTSQCHAGLSAIPRPHAPVKEGQCSPCHVQRTKAHPVAGGKSFELTGKGVAICKDCHDTMGKKKFQHAPVKDGECTACHKPHGTANKFLLETGEDQNPLCLGCHEGPAFKQKFMHGPTAVGNCTECHDPHESDLKPLLKGGVRELCLKCHADFEQAMAAAGFVHPPVKEGPCTACHNPHGSPYPFFLIKKVPELCVSCHTKVGQKMASVKVPHKPLMMEGSCVNCHQPHFSKGKGLLPTDEINTCLGCHGVNNFGNPPLRNIKKDMEGKKYLHGPIRKGECKACHDPHGSNSFRILRGDYPAQLYTPYTKGAYDGCLICHEKNLLRFPDTTLYTNFRNGKKNLHYVHVAKTRKGRTCRVCHQPHASDEEKMINKDGVQFGEWHIPLNFKKTPTGGGCLPGCHRALKYDRVKPEAN